MLATPGIPYAGRWKEIVRKGFRKRSGDGRKPVPVLSAESRATPGYVMRVDVVANRHGNSKVRLWQVQRSSAAEVVLVRLQKRVKGDEKAKKGGRITVPGREGGFGSHGKGSCGIFMMIRKLFVSYALGCCRH